LVSLVTANSENNFTAPSDRVVMQATAAGDVSVHRNVVANTGNVVANGNLVATNGNVVALNGNVEALAGQIRGRNFVQGVAPCDPIIDGSLGNVVFCGANAVINGFTASTPAGSIIHVRSPHSRFMSPFSDILVPDRENHKCWHLDDHTL
jgi:hypothetical protein